MRAARSVSEGKPAHWAAFVAVGDWLYPESVVSLAILGDEDPGWKPKRYKHKQIDTKVSLRFKTVKLWEYNDRWAELENDPNPVAVVVMAHLKTKATRGDGPRRLSWKVEVVRQASAEQIMKWAKRLLLASSLDEVFAT